MTLNFERVSLQVGSVAQLTSDHPGPVAWASDNPRVRVTPLGRISAPEDHLRPHGQATITCTALDTGEATTAAVTIVSWPANRHRLVMHDTIDSGLLSLHDGWEYRLVSNGRTFQRSNDGWQTRESLPEVPVGASYVIPGRILFTPHGAFVLLNDGTVLRSRDGLQSWSVSTVLANAPLVHGYDWTTRGDGATVVMVGEYSTERTDHNRVVRGVITDNGETWDTAMSWHNRDEFDADPSKTPYIRHVHAVVTDPYTGGVFVGTGDRDAESRVLVTTDSGDTFTELGTGGQKWRPLDFWFTQEYVYWNTDSEEPQAVWRLHRDDLAAQASGSDLSQKVADLDNGSLWYVVPGTDTRGRPVWFQTAAAEGQIRDWFPRVYMVWEDEDGSAHAEEVLSAPTSTPSVYSSHAQFVPNYEHDGLVYLTARSMAAEYAFNSRWRLEKVEAVPVPWAAPGAFVPPGKFI